MGDEHTIIAVATNDMAVTSKRAVDILQLKDKLKNTGKSLITDLSVGFLVLKSNKTKRLKLYLSINQHTSRELLKNSISPMLNPFQHLWNQELNFMLNNALHQ